MSDYREIFEKIPDGITLHDPADGSILDTNQQFCEMLGYTREELLGLDFDALHVDEPPYTSERAEAHVQRAATEGPQTFEWRDRTKDGEELPVEVHLRQTTIDGDRRILAVVRDITERKRREAELERKNQRLEEFANVVSHDLRNPLNVAEARLELASEECDSDHLPRVDRAHQRMDTLIEDLLTLARVGETKSDREAVDLQTVVDRCWETVETTDATLANDATHTIRADRNRLRQALENVLRNAVEHGGDAVHVRVGDHQDGFFVADDGPGIPEAERDRVFETGYSSSETGTGFGLQIVETVADAHGWSVRVSAADDGGARFEFSGVSLV